MSAALAGATGSGLDESLGNVTAALLAYVNSTIAVADVKKGRFLINGVEHTRRRRAGDYVFEIVLKPTITQGTAQAAIAAFGGSRNVSVVIDYVLYSGVVTPTALPTAPTTPTETTAVPTLPPARALNKSPDTDRFLWFIGLPVLLVLALVGLIFCGRSSQAGTDSAPSNTGGGGGLTFDNGSYSFL